MFEYNPLDTLATPTIQAFPEVSEAMLAHYEAIMSLEGGLDQYQIDAINPPGYDGEPLGLGRKNVRRLSDTELLNTRLCFALGRAALEQPEDPESFLDNTLEDLFKTKLHIPSSHFMEGVIKLDIMQYGITSMHELVLYDKLHKTIGEFEGYVNQNTMDTKGQYNLMRILANDIRYDEDHPDEIDGIWYKSNLIFNHGVAYRAFMDGSEMLHMDLRRKLVAGHFDDFLAKEQLDGCVSEEVVINSAGDLFRAVRLVMHVGNMAAQDAVNVLRDPELHALWPSEAQRQLAGTRSAYAEKLSDNARYHAKRIYANGLDGGKLGEVDLGDLFEDSMHALERKSNEKRIPRHAVVSYNIKKRRRKSLPENDIPPESSTTEVAEERAPRQLYAVDSSGSQSGTEDPVYQKMLDDYLKVYNDSQLEAELYGALAWLQKVDLTQGRVPGVAKYQYKVRDLGEQRVAYGFKPSAVPGLSTASRRAKGLRIVFTLDTDQDRIGLVFIGDRSKIATWERGQRVSGAKND